MSLFDYAESKRMGESDPPFAAWIMGAYRKADTDNAALLRAAFPEIVEELQQRYDAPGGLLPGEVQS